MITGYELTIEQTQRPQMTQELIQAIKILQFNNQELNEYIENELLENPFLEAQKEANERAVDIDELRERLLEINQNAKDSEYLDNWVSEKEEFSFERYVSYKYTLVDHLLPQLAFSGLSDEELKVGRYIIECIDDNGYLTSSIEEISNALGVDCEFTEKVLKVVQGFYPVGVAARNLEECLKIQLEHKGESDKRVFDIALNRLEDIGNNRISQIAKDMGLDVLEVQRIADKIKTLEPKPGRIFNSDNNIKYVIPDVHIEKDGEDLFVRSDEEGVPRLSISPLYYDLKEKEEGEEELKSYINEKFNSALWLIKSIEQRKNTIYKVASEILKFQDAFFRKGTKYLKPLTLKQVGDAVGIHESTVSRAINGKYIECDKGVFELKYFFSGGLKAFEGEDLSSNSVKEMIKEIVDSENPKNPYSDLKIAELLNKEGVDISRRTIAKYREAMGIQSSSKRRRF